ncbi:MAG: hypothetical protein ACD_60C00007G0018 [uncultured bacterium]|nr:MAG: hypothetical protein ACD_60C00007G0018 [uncultured bacterium]
MKSAAVIDFTAYMEQRSQPEPLTKHAQPSYSEELGIAIQTLIQQLRQSNPFKKPFI